MQKHEEASRLKAKANQDIEQSKAEALLADKRMLLGFDLFFSRKIIVTTNLDKEAQSNLIDSYLDKLGDA